MKNLALFIWRNYFFFLFLILEVISFYFLVSKNYYQKASFVNSSNAATGSMLEAYSGFTDYLKLKNTNLLLAQENADLKKYTRNSYAIYVDKTFLKSSVVKLNDTVYRQQYEYFPAKVVNNSVSNQKNYLTLNVGRKQGAERDMAVISSNGIVGIINDVSDNYCSVMSVLHRDLRVSSKIKKDGSFGPLNWNGDSYREALLTDIPTHVKLKPGDTVVTSAYSTVFPEDIMVGTVVSFERKATEYFYTVKVKLSTDFKKLDYVYVVKNFFREEQIELEKKAQKRDN